MKLIPVLTLYIDICKGGLAAEPVLYCIYNMPDFYKKIKFSANFFIWVRLSFSSARINPSASNSALPWSSDTIWCGKRKELYISGRINCCLRKKERTTIFLAVLSFFKINIKGVNVYYFCEWFVWYILFLWRPATPGIAVCLFFCNVD